MNRFQPVALIVMAGLVAGCATPARIEQMKVDAPLAARVAASNSALKEKVALKDVTGGRETNPMWVSSVGSAEFERALEQSLQEVGLLALNRQASPFHLTAHLLKLDQPLMGASMTVTATVQYSLVERTTGKEVFSRTLSTPYTAAWNASFLGAERLKLANEGAIRENIKQLIETLIPMKLSAVPVFTVGE
jgi:hypothetical protein